MQGSRVVEVQTEQIGIINFITAESFNAGALMIYSMFDVENEIIGSQMILGSVGNKRIYPFPNPGQYFDEEEKKSGAHEFDQYYLTAVRQINFRARLVGEADIVCLTQVRFN